MINSPAIQIDAPNVDFVYKFRNYQEAVLFARLKGLMVVKEQGQDFWYVVPKFNGVRTFSYESED